jgi:hypothetical protein
MAQNHLQVQARFFFFLPKKTIAGI